MIRFLGVTAVFFGLFLASSCEKPYQCPVPAIELFSFDINLNNSEFAPLQSSLGAVTKNSGCGSPNGTCGYNNHGIIIFRYVYDNEILAYDATCPNDSACINSKSARVEVDKTNPSQVQCSRCKSVYSLVDGRHNQKRIELRRYNVYPLPNYTKQYRVSNR
jgi:nitrite reductase/ring-hydroxylating ferredoxin subunit